MSSKLMHRTNLQGYSLAEIIQLFTTRGIIFDYYIFSAMFLHETRKKKSASEQDSASTKISYCFLQYVYIVFTASKEIHPSFVHTEETMEAAT